MDLDPEALRQLQATLLDGLGASPRGHQPTQLERMAVYARYRLMREAHYGPMPARERTAGPRNSLSQESPLVRKIFGG